MKWKVTYKHKADAPNTVTHTYCVETRPETKSAYIIAESIAHQMMSTDVQERFNTSPIYYELVKIERVFE